MPIFIFIFALLAVSRSSKAVEEVFQGTSILSRGSINARAAGLAWVPEKLSLSASALELESNLV